MSTTDQAEHDRQIKAEAWQECVERFASYGAIVKGSALDRAESENPYLD